VLITPYVRKLLVIFALGVAAAGAAVAEAHFDHPVPSFAPSAPLSTAMNAGGRDADWELVTTIPTGNPHTDLDFFTSGGETYASVGTLAAGPNAGGQTIVKLTEKGLVEPSYVTGHPSASCLSSTTSATGLQHDVEATPKGGALLNSPNLHADRRDAQLLVDATDAGGRCHDQGAFGASAPQGGLELIDITDPTKPKEIGLTTHIGQAHTVNVDPKRPHIAFDITQDGVTVGEDGKRSNETSGNALDGFEIVDMSSCMNFPAGTTLEEKRDRCRPQVYRYRYPDPGFATASSFPKNLQSCHEVEIYPDDRLACASITATILFDLSGAFDDNGTPTDYTDDKPRGEPLPCRVRDSSTVAPVFATGAKVTDCVNGEVNGAPQSLTVSQWLKIGSPSLQGVRRIGTIHHMGFASAAEQALAPPFDSTQDVFAAHEAELTGSGKHLLTTDERGGGIVPNGATCSPGVDNKEGNGGISAYPLSKLRTTPPSGPEEAQQQYATSSDGQRAIYRAAVRTGPQGSFCTAHVFQQIPGQNRIFMGWYSQGTQVVDFVERGDGTIDFAEAGWMVPENANTWTSHVFKVQENQDGTFTYWGATGDFALAGTGRNAVDIYKVTLPPAPRATTPDAPGTPTFPTSDVKGVEVGGPAPACAASASFEAVRARPRGGGLRFSFSRRGGPVTVDVVRESVGRRISPRGVRVARFRGRTKAFTWKPRGRSLRSGYYSVRFSSRAGDGQRDVRRVALRRARGKFRRLAAFEKREACALLSSFGVSRPVFSRGRALRIQFRLRENAGVTISVRRKGRTVKRFRGDYAAGRTHTVRFRAGRGGRIGDHRVVLLAEHPGKTSQAVVVARRLR
jgi:hypothetical protein